MKVRITILGIILGGLFVLNITTAAQSNVQNGLRLTILDNQSQVIAGAKCVLSQNSKTASEVQTDASGMAIFTGISSGLYDLKIEKDGFKKYEKIALKINADTMFELAVTLEVGTVSAEVTVENSAENVNSVETGSSPPSADIKRKTMERLPLATARVDEAIPLIPGVIRSTTGEISINGANEQQSAFRVNGLNVADPSSGKFRLNLPIDAINQFQPN